MKNQYVGDVNDYRKYGLLRVLGAELSLSVHWMLTPDDARPDGQKTTYLSKSAAWRHFDPELFDSLHRTVSLNERSVASVERSGVLGNGTLFWNALVETARERRGAQFDAVVAGSMGHDILFFDPDNGMEVKSVGLGARAANKYLYWHEARAASRSQHSVLFYQHFPRVERGAMKTGLAARCLSELRADRVWCLSTSHVLFVLAAHERHAAALTRAVDGVADRWAGQFEISLHT